MEKSQPPEVYMEWYRSALQAGYPAAASSGLALAGLLRQQLVNGLPLRPSKFTCLGFGSAFGLGTWMMYDGDYRNGAGFTAVWSTLYLMASKKTFARGIYPSTLWLLVGSNAISYAVEFARTPPEPAGELPVLPPPDIK